MKKIFIWLAAIIGGAVALLIAAILILPRFIDVASYTPKIERKVSAATGRPFTLGRDFHVSVFPWVGVSFSGLSLGNPAEFGGGEFVRVQSFEARMKLLPLLSNKIEIKKFVLDGPQIMLTKLENGAVNWVFPDQKSSSKKGTSAEGQRERKTEGKKGVDFALNSLDVGEFSVTNGSIVYRDKTLGQTKEITGITFKLEDVSLDRPISLSFQAEVDGKPLAVNGSIGPVGSQPGNGTLKVDLQVNAMKQLVMNVAGEIIDAAADPNFKLKLSISDFSPRQLMASLGQAMPVQTTDPSVLNTVSADLNIHGSPTSFSLTNGRIMIDDSTLKLEAAVGDLGKPDISFSLDIDSINLDRYLPPPAREDEEQKTDTAKGQSFAVAANNSEKTAQESGSTIDYGPLRRMVISGSVSVAQLVAHGARIENIVLTLSGKDGTFKLDPFSFSLYHGRLGVVGDFDVREDTVESSLVVKGEDIQVGPLLRESMNKDILEGSVSVDAGIRFSGDRSADIKKSLSGKGVVQFLDGALVGIDLAEMARNITSGLGVDKPKEKPRTDFAELSVPFIMNNGIFQTSDTRLLSPLLRVNILGNANLVTEALDFKVRPTVVATLKGQGDTDQRSGITVPILVEGTFAKPKYTADLSAIASEELVQEALKDPQGTVDKAKAAGEVGKKLLKNFGFGN